MTISDLLRYDKMRFNRLIAMMCDLCIKRFGFGTPYTDEIEQHHRAERHGAPTAGCMRYYGKP